MVAHILLICLVAYTSQLLLPVAAQQVSQPLSLNQLATSFLQQPDTDALSCSVTVSVQLLDSAFAPGPPQPTVSPRPALVLGLLELSIANLAADAVLAPWRLEAVLPAKVAIINGTSPLGIFSQDSDNATDVIFFNGASNLDPSGSNPIIVTATLLSDSPLLIPNAVLLNGQLCRPSLAVNLSAEVPPMPFRASENVTSLLSSGASGAISASGGQFFVNGQQINLAAINWYGFETQFTMVGLGDGSNQDSLTRDFAALAYRVQLLGFNAIRLPMSLSALFYNSPISYTYGCRVSPPTEIRANSIDPAVSVPGSAQPPPIFSPPSTYGSGTCNDYLPNSSILTRFLYVVRYLVRQGFYILIDNHLEADPIAATNPEAWLQLWKQLLTLLIQDPASKNQVMIDVLNEPDAFQFRWEPQPGSPYPGVRRGMTDLYLTAMDAFYQISPKTLFFVEGHGQLGLAQSYGDGFCTDTDVIRAKGLSDPNSFFQQVLNKPYINNVVISPHLYPPTVGGFTYNFSGPGLVYRLTKSWGYLTKAPGYCHGSKCHVFPVAVGEIGSSLQGKPATPQDLAFFHTIIEYFRDVGEGVDGLHSRMLNIFWWCLNASPDSLGAGNFGMTTTQSGVNIAWPRVHLLEQMANLRPWFSQYQPGPLPFFPSQTFAPPPPPPKPKSPPPRLASPPPRAASPPPAVNRPSPTSPTGTPCSAEVMVASYWPNGDGTNSAAVNILLRSKDAAIPVPYKVSFGNPRYLNAQRAWNLVMSGFASGTVQGSTDPANSWQSLSSNGANTANVGTIIVTASTDFAPTSVAINGVACSISSNASSGK